MMDDRETNPSHFADAKPARRLLSSGYRWVVLRPGDYAHMLNVEHHWKPGKAIGISEFDFNEHLAPKTECGVSTGDGKFHFSMMSAREAECCPECWKLALR